MLTQINSNQSFKNPHFVWCREISVYGLNHSLYVGKSPIENIHFEKYAYMCGLIFIDKYLV